MKGIILAGGSGSRLFPLTKVMSKQLQPVYDKPMIYYPLSLLMLGGVRDILVISTDWDRLRFEALLGDGSSIGMRIEYKIQDRPAGIPEAFIIGESFIGQEDVALILGDNLFHGNLDFFHGAVTNQAGKKDGRRARIFGYPVADPQRYGVVEFERSTWRIQSLEEKPALPKSNYAIPGLYLFDHKVVEKAFSLRPSKRGELEIIDILRAYFEEGTLDLTPMTRGVAWLDMGTPKSLLEASSYIMAVEERQGLKVGCLEEIALRMGYLSLKDYGALLQSFPNSSYRDYLESIGEDFKKNIIMTRMDG